MRFEDGLDTVLAQQVAGPAGLQAMWRQAVDLIGRRRGGPVGPAIERLRQIRDDVPVEVRAASARGLERAHPPAALVALFAEDDARVAGPVVRSARLSANEWIALLPRMRPATRGVLRHRRDLSETVERALAAFGPDDFVLPGGGMAADRIAPAAVPQAGPIGEAEQRDTGVGGLSGSAGEPPAERQRSDTPPAFVAPEPFSFVSVSAAARELPIVVEALRQEQVATAPSNDDDFAIAALVARIEAHRRDAPEPRPTPIAPPAEHFRFETDARGMLRWCDHAVRGPLIGLSLAAGRDGAPVATDGGAGGAFTRRARISDARLVVPGTSAAAGAWRINAVPAFDRASGRFTGYRGTARRPRPDEQPRPVATATASDSLRQLVHELRTPANAISGFAEMIERELLGPVPPAYRAHAAEIVGQTAGLLGAIDDLDTAARIESNSLDLRLEAVRLAPVLEEVTRDLLPLAELRGATLVVEVAPDAVVSGDARAIDRLFSRLMTALVASAGRGEDVAAAVMRDGETVHCVLSRPAALSVGEGALFSADAEVEAAAAGAPLLGSGFAFRLARRLVGELGGTLTIGAEALTLRLPAAVNAGMEQATN